MVVKNHLHSSSDVQEVASGIIFFLFFFFFFFLSLIFLLPLDIGTILHRPPLARVRKPGTEEDVHTPPDGYENLGIRMPNIYGCEEI